MGNVKVYIWQLIGCLFSKPQMIFHKNKKSGIIFHILVTGETEAIILAGCCGGVIWHSNFDVFGHFYF
jgi:hypothetical protein